MLGMKYLKGESNEERLAGLLLCLKEIEGKTEMNEDDTSTVLSTLSAEFICRLVCTRDEVVRSAGVRFLSLLSPKHSEAFTPFLSPLIVNENRQPFVDQEQISEMVLLFVGQCIRNLEPNSSLIFIENSLLNATQTKYLRPIRILVLISSVASSLPPSTRLSASAASVLRELITQCMYGGGNDSLRRDMLECTAHLLLTLDPDWTVNSISPTISSSRNHSKSTTGSFAHLLCSIVHGELRLSLDTLLLPPEPTSSSTTTSDSILSSCSSILISAGILLAGSPSSNTDAAGPWTRLPPEELLAVRVCVHGAMTSFSSFLADANPQLSAHRFAAAALAPAMCSWAALDCHVADILARITHTLLKHSSLVSQDGIAAAVSSIEASDKSPDPDPFFALLDLILESLVDYSDAIPREYMALIDSLTEQDGWIHIAFTFGIALIPSYSRSAAIRRNFNGVVRGVMAITARRMLDVAALLRVDGDAAWDRLLGVSGKDVRKFVQDVRHIKDSSAVNTFLDMLSPCLLP